MKKLLLILVSLVSLPAKSNEIQKSNNTNLIWRTAKNCALIAGPMTLIQRPFWNAKKEIDGITQFYKVCPKTRLFLSTALGKATIPILLSGPAMLIALGVLKYCLIGQGLIGIYTDRKKLCSFAKNIINKIDTGIS